MVSATRRASYTSSKEQQRPCTDSGMPSWLARRRWFQSCMVKPTTSCPSARSMAATVEESTPPDMATAMVLGLGIRALVVSLVRDPQRQSGVGTLCQHILVPVRESICMLALNINCTDYAPIFGGENRNDELRTRTGKSCQIAAISVYVVDDDRQFSADGRRSQPLGDGKIGMGWRPGSAEGDDRNQLIPYVINPNPPVVTTALNDNCNPH